MTPIGKKKRVSRFVPSLAVALMLCAACRERQEQAQGERSVDHWTRIERVGRYTFVGDVLEDEDLSSLACISGRYGLIGADEACAVQVVELSRDAKTLTIVRTVPLIASDEEIDIEGIAASANGYYIIGSHGISKKRGERQDSRFAIFHLAADSDTGMPLESGGARAASLSHILRADRALGDHFGKPLQHKGVNIEGLAIRDGRLFVGFRGPNLDGDAFVMEIAADDVFSRRSQPSYTLHRLALGPGLGIREIVASRKGFLLIAGNAGSAPSGVFDRAEDYDEDRGFSLYFWGGPGHDVRRIGAIPDASGKAEAMAILEEAADCITVLILFDGPERGRPSIYRIS